MVKNMGGKNTKRGPRSQAPIYFRPPENEDELVGIIEKNMGQGTLMVKFSNGKTSLCHVRKKFGKERNSIKVGGWVLVGLRSFETTQKNSDLLEIYSDMDVKRLLTMDGPWRSFEVKDDINFDFVETVEVEKTELVLDMEINFDDI
jgi:initiation factor 1A